MIGAQPLEHLEKARPGHGDVQQHHVGRQPREQGEHFVAVHGFPHDLQARVIRHDAAEPLPHHRMIVGDQEPDHGTHPGRE